MAVFECRHCKFRQLTPWAELCPGCGGFYRPQKLGADSAEQRAEKGEYGTLGARAKKTRHYISTGSDGFNKVLGGGLVAGKVVLFGGFPGAGKTRFLLARADHVAKTQGRVIYATGEESADDLFDVAGDLGVVNDQVTIMGNQRRVELVLEEARRIQAFLIVWDSAQKLTSDDAGGSPGSISQCKAIGEAIKSYCGETKTCSIIVNQMSQGGELKGGTELEHHCDVVMVLEFAQPEDDEAPLGTNGRNTRMLRNNKNRVGVENAKSYWHMNEAGILECVPGRSKIIEMPLRSKYQRRERDEAED